MKTPAETLVLRFAAPADGVPTAVRVRQLIKYAGRRCNLRFLGYGDGPGTHQPASDARSAAEVPRESLERK